MKENNLNNKETLYIPLCYLGLANEKEYTKEEIENQVDFQAWEKLKKTIDKKISVCKEFKVPYDEIRITLIPVLFYNKEKYQERKGILNPGTPPLPMYMGLYLEDLIAYKDGIPEEKIRPLGRGLGLKIVSWPKFSDQILEEGYKIMEIKGINDEAENLLKEPSKRKNLKLSISKKFPKTKKLERIRNK